MIIRIRVAFLKSYASSSCGSDGDVGNLSRERGDMARASAVDFDDGVACGEAVLDIGVQAGEFKIMLLSVSDVLLSIEMLILAASSLATETEA